MKVGKVLSLFDGISCGQLALHKSGIEYETYYAAEIDSSPIKVTQHNFPNTVQLGDVTKINGTKFGKIDLFFGGSPCQGFSRSGKFLKFDDPRSMLFFEYVRILDEIRQINPDVIFLLENVKMEQWCQDIISEYLKVYPILIDSALVSAQSRPRLYWTNIPGVEVPQDRCIMLEDVIGRGCVGVAKRGRKDDKGIYQQQLELRKDGKCNALTTVKKDTMILDNSVLRKLTRNECELLQTVPVGYTDVIGGGKAMKALGNGWTVDVIAHIFSFLIKGNPLSMW